MSHLIIYRKIRKEAEWGSEEEGVGWLADRQTDKQTEQK